jgi:hypothetical protein
MHGRTALVCERRILGEEARMNMKDLIPWSRAENKTPAIYRDTDPFYDLAP